MIATKDQERKALNKIKDIIASLGENSYIATAFEGCIKVAEDNINNDFACSILQQYEIAEKRIKELQKINNILINKVNTEKTKNEQLSKRVFDNNDLSVMEYTFVICFNQYTEKMEKAANNIILYADDPTSNEFISAVDKHRKYSSNIEELSNILHKIREKKL